MEGIKIRQLIKTDISVLAKLANNKNVWDNLRDYFPYPYTEQDADFFIESTTKENPKLTFGILTEKNELCGVIGLVIQKDIYRLTTEIGYWLGEDYWGKGITTKAIELITKYGFENLKLERIHTGVFENNNASMRALEKNGYQKEGIFRNCIIKNGVIRDEHRYSILTNKKGQ